MLGAFFFIYACCKWSASAPPRKSINSYHAYIISAHEEYFKISDLFKFIRSVILIMKTEKAPDIFEIVKEIVSKLDMEHIDVERIKCMRSFGSTSNAYARIYSMPKIMQKALEMKAHYIIEVISESFDNLSEEDKGKTILHELLHIPKTFSGALVNHKMVCFDGKGGHETRRINRSTVEKIWKRMNG